MSKSRHLVVGQVGERVAERYLAQRGFALIERNYRRPWGEIDLVMIKDGLVHFVEVKSTECDSEPVRDGVEAHRPEDHMHHAKCERLARVIETYLMNAPHIAKARWTADLLVVYINLLAQRAHVRVYADILLTS